MSLEQIRRAFSAFDTDQSGSLSRSELEHILTQPVAGHPPALTSAEVEELIHRFDVNGDGELQIDEFVQAYRLLTESAVREDATRALEHASGLAGAAEDASSHGSQWTLRGWLQALPTSAALASVLHQSAGGAPSEIDLVRQIRGRDQMLALLKAGDTLEQLADVLWEGVETLMASAAESAIELQEKFLLAGAGLMSYGDLGTFYRGLEGKVGTPSPRVGEAMESEHTACGDAQVKFATGNYGVVTTSEIEWRFVAKPDRPPHDGWPLESKLSAAKNSMLHGSSGAGGTSSRLKRLPTVLRGGADFRQPLLLHDLDARMHDKNDSLHELNEPKLTIEETFGSRLYTGPCFEKYNSVLRGLDVPVLRHKMVELCCSTSDFDGYKSGAVDYDTLRAERRLNMYTTTIHAINSAIVKLSKLTVATKLFRGISGRVLPPEFLEANRFGVMGGIEGAFMSTTTGREVAMHYAAKGGAGVVLEVQQGMINRGAELAWISQYPHEAEVLFAPLTGLEVQSTRVEGSVLVCCVALSVNLTALTIEQVVGKRRKMLVDMSDGMAVEIRSKLATEGFEAACVTAFTREVGATVLSEDRVDDWFNSDDRFVEAVTQVLVAKRAAVENATERAAMMAKRLDRAELIAFGAEKLKVAGFDAGQLKVVGFDVGQLKVTGFDAGQLKAAGFDAGQLKAVGFDLGQLKAAGFDAGQLKNVAGFNAQQIRQAFSISSDASAARAAGFDAGQLKVVGFDAGQLKSAGFDVGQLKAVGFDAGQLKSVGFDAGQLRVAGFDAGQLKSVGFDAGQLKKTGFGAVQLKVAGFGAVQLKVAGFDAGQLKAAGFDAGQLKAVGFGLGQLKNVAGFNAQQMRQAFSISSDASAARAAGFDAGQLKAVGFDAGQLKSAGFDVGQLKLAGFDAGQLKVVGFDAGQLKVTGFGAVQLKVAGFDVGQLKVAGFNAKQLKAAALMWGS